MSISEFLPTLSSEQVRKIHELADCHQQYIDSILEHSDYSFANYLDDTECQELSDFNDKLAKAGVGFVYSMKIEITGCKEIACGNAGKIKHYECFTLVE